MHAFRRRARPSMGTRVIMVSKSAITAAARVEFHLDFRFVLPFLPLFRPFIPDAFMALRRTPSSGGRSCGA